MTAPEPENPVENAAENIDAAAMSAPATGEEIASALAYNRLRRGMIPSIPPTAAGNARGLFDSGVWRNAELEPRKRLARELAAVGYFAQAQEVAPEIGAEIDRQRAAFDRPDTEQCGCRGARGENPMVRQCRIGSRWLYKCAQCGFENLRAEN